MNAWQKLLAASQLAAGTAWQLISNPKTGLGGGVIVNDGVSVEVGEEPFDVEVSEVLAEVEVSAASVDVEVMGSPVEVEVDLAGIEVEVLE